MCRSAGATCQANNGLHDGILYRNHTATLRPRSRVASLVHSTTGCKDIVAYA